VDIDRHDGELPFAPELFDDEDLEPLGSDGPAFTVDDVIEFHYLLQDDAYIREFLASSGG